MEVVAAEQFARYQALASAKRLALSRQYGDLHCLDPTAPTLLRHTLAWPTPFPRFLLKHPPSSFQHGYSLTLNNKFIIGYSRWHCRAWECSTHERCPPNRPSSPWRGQSRVNIMRNITNLPPNLDSTSLACPTCANQYRNKKELLHHLRS